MKSCTKKYLNNCKNLLPIYKKEEKAFIKMLKNNLLDFESENDNISYDDIVNRFGTPTATITSYIEELDTDILMKNINQTKIIKKFALIIMVVISVITISTALYETYRFEKLCRDFQENDPAIIETTIE